MLDIKKFRLSTKTRTTKTLSSYKIVVSQGKITTYHKLIYLLRCKTNR